jgi:ABC-type proline/glycine betaine transport system ATPase subunit
MVTHDVDEALFLADRIVCMTNGPEAEVGDIVEVKFARPRIRQAVMEHADYYKLRERLIEFLEVRAHKQKPAARSPAQAKPNARRGFQTAHPNEPTAEWVAVAADASSETAKAGALV